MEPASPDGFSAFPILQKVILDADDCPTKKRLQRLGKNQKLPILSCLETDHAAIGLLPDSPLRNGHYALRFHRGLENTILRGIHEGEVDLGLAGFLNHSGKAGDFHAKISLTRVGSVLQWRMRPNATSITPNARPRCERRG